MTAKRKPPAPRPCTDDHELAETLKRLEHIMSASLDALKALEPRLDAIAAAVGTDTATAVANAVAPLNQQISDLQAAATQTETDTASEAGVLAGKIATIETAVGIAAPAPAAS